MRFERRSFSVVRAKSTFGGVVAWLKEVFSLGERRGIKGIGLLATSSVAWTVIRTGFSTYAWQWHDDLEGKLRGLRDDCPRRTGRVGGVWRGERYLELLFDHLDPRSVSSAA